MSQEIRVAFAGVGNWGYGSDLRGGQYRSERHGRHGHGLGTGECGRGEGPFPQAIAVVSGHVL